MAANEKVDLWAVDEVHFQQHGSRRPDVGSSGSQGSGAAAKSPGYPDIDGRSLFLYLIPMGIAVDVNRRDLEGFARLHLVIGCLQKAIADGTIEVGLEWRDVGQKGGSPSIKAYQAAEVDGGSEYVKKADQTWASNQVIGERGWSADGFVRSS